MVLCWTSGKPPHPQDGPWSWLVCVVATTCNAIQLGFQLSYGVFLPILMDYFKESRAKAAWVGSLSISVTFFMGLLSSKLAERFGSRPVAMIGGLICALALVISSFIDSLTAMFFSYGLLFGVGAGLVFSAGYSMLYKYHRKNQAVAIGFVASGAGIGLIVMAPTLQALIDALGWRNTLKSMSGIMLIMSILSTTYDPNVKEERTEYQTPNTLHDRRVDNEITVRTNGQNGDTRSYRQQWQLAINVVCSVLKCPTYTIGMITTTLVYYGLFLPNIHLIRFAEDLYISATSASRLFIYFGILSTAARALTGRLYDRHWLTATQGIQIAAIIMGISTILLSLAKTYTHFVVFVVFSGFGNGMFVTAQMVLFMTCFQEENMKHTSLGIGLVAASFGILGGPPFVGFIADKFGSYIPAFYIVGGIFIFAALFPFSLQLFRQSDSQLISVSLDECNAVVPTKQSSTSYCSGPVVRSEDNFIPEIALNL